MGTWAHTHTHHQHTHTHHQHTHTHHQHTHHHRHTHIITTSSSPTHPFPQTHAPTWRSPSSTRASTLLARTPRPRTRTSTTTSWATALTLTSRRARPSSRAEHLL